jgi:site-specific recombinase XerD
MPSRAHKTLRFPLHAFLAFLAEDTKVGERTARQYIAHLYRFAAWLEQRYQAVLLEATNRDLRQYKTELGTRQSRPR